jgi:anti-sigma factor RsiW
MALLIQADIDGELRPAEAAPATAHRMTCAYCERVYQELSTLRRSLRDDLEHHAPSPQFRAFLSAKLVQTANASAVATSIATSVNAMPVAATSGIKTAPPKTPNSRWRALSTFGAGAALAATLIFMIDTPSETMLVDAVVAGHIRALQPGHLMDVVSSDQHNVKPWFDGKLDFAPPVKNLAEEGFPLQGGRLDYLNGRPVAALVYARGKHSINLFVCPEANQKAPADIATGFYTVDGYNVYHWRQNDMILWAVSDLNKIEMGQFIDAWKTMRF